ncbi:MAG TPA: hypothetical protein VGC41_17115 [Kofleriaceae bacterium]
MLIAIERLLWKLRQPRSRADELIALQQRIVVEQAKRVSAEEQQLAAEVRAKKLAVSALLSEVKSCASCETASPYSGGACCGGHTPDLFDDRELAALVHAGTTAHDLDAPRGADPHLGCAFRGPRGCTLDLAHRPGRCVHYVCNILKRELHRHGELDALEAALAELNASVQRYTAVYQARCDREVLDPIVDAIRSART